MFRHEPDNLPSFNVMNKKFKEKGLVNIQMDFSGILWFLLSFFVVESWQVSKVSSFEFSQLWKFRPRDHFWKNAVNYTVELRK